MTRINDRIRAPKVRVVTANGEQLGVMSSREALAKAQSVGLDLVEIAGQADPPVCKIIDYGKYKYTQAKLKKGKSKSSTRMKEVKFRVGTGQESSCLNFFSTRLKAGRKPFVSALRMLSATPGALMMAS